MVIRRGEIWWAALADARGSEPGYRRPVVVVQADEFNASKLATVMVIPLTSTTRLAAAPGNVLLQSGETDLPRVSVALVSQVLTIDRTFLEEPVRRLRPAMIHAIDAGLRMALGL